MTKFLEISKIFMEDIPSIMATWEASVRATHAFLSEEDIQFFRPYVKKAIAETPHLFCVRDDSKAPIAFMAIETKKIEMLFVHPDHRGKGLGKRLIEYAIHKFAAERVDVNEQNEAATGFYLKMGFHILGRTELDPFGKPFPILHMGLNPNFQT